MISICNDKLTEEKIFDKIFSILTYKNVTRDDIIQAPDYIPTDDILQNDLLSGVNKINAAITNLKCEIKKSAFYIERAKKYIDKKN